MSGAQSGASKDAMNINRDLAQRYYGVAIPALEARQGSINKSLDAGQPQYLQDAYAGQRAGLTEGLSGAAGAAQARATEGAGQALSGGNQFANLHPQDMGAMLANALYGSKFQQGQANLNQQFNLMSMGLGGAGSAGNAALQASGNELQAIGMLPKYNETYASILGAANTAAAGYGAYKQQQGNNAFSNWLSNGGYAMVPGMAPSGAMWPTSSTIGMVAR